MGQFLVFVGSIAVMLGVVFLAGAANSGSVRGGWFLLRTWVRIVAVTAAVGALLALVVLQIIPAP